MRQSNLKAIAHVTAQNPPESELLSRLSEIETPTLVLFGVEDQLIPPGNGRLYVERMPDCHHTLPAISSLRIGQTLSRERCPNSSSAAPHSSSTADRR